MATNPHVTTAQELDAMTPAERHQHFLDSIVDPATLTPEQLNMIHQRGEAMVAEYEDRRRQRAS